MRTVEEPCVAAAAASRSRDVLDARALTALLDPPPASPASPPLARSASIICAKRYVARDCVHARLITSMAPALRSSSSPAAMSAVKCSARSSWKMEK